MKLRTYMKPLIIVAFLMTGLTMQSQVKEKEATDMMFRISEIEIFPEHLDAYTAILKEEAAASIRLEPGVISILPLYQKKHPNVFRILEIYRSKEAYQAHLRTPHFKHYKESTLKMVKSLKLVDMDVLDEAVIELIFKKIKI